MSKKGRSNVFSLDIPNWKDSNNVILFMIGSALAGFAFGMGNVLADLVLKASVLKLSKDNPALVPEELKEQIPAYYQNPNRKPSNLPSQ